MAPRYRVRIQQHRRPRMIIPAHATTSPSSGVKGVPVSIAPPKMHSPMIRRLGIPPPIDIHIILEWSSCMREYVLQLTDGAVPSGREC
ncbi:hypothetical protein HBI56_093850 [Parastagonospora nodorum]|uniref:Uncharacterized protein n=1 Tax=Phaeosphaeria nodorum (strain SN15 / ATCC MYA-4574 / FGSC 10173) TaxID=321614 RepID=A0A7U2HZX1_PHANO|nr:hypothetical protein HBH56_089130 [Parastagonospora nodorum]QRC98115.1 hypothetical protein JI435_042210 [Parastagonospora nodorum SN15]KAH3936450.1 hypothetical protein HBH54_023770 [Parastagonospora nodorum]KAH3945779.1 hypothetical protein HBH53_140870 [Parastagonospora nodorum]KAH3966384.1 hypothetical protein HBH51_144500 [Parastagonospora nodorum]